MKQLAIIPILIFLAAAIGYAVLRGLGMHPFTREMLLTLVPCLVGGMVGMTPALLQRGNGQAAVVQGSFQGMIAHMGATLALAVVAFIVGRPHGLNIPAFAMWMSWFFFVALTAVSYSLIRVVKSTPIAPAARV